MGSGSDGIENVACQTCSWRKEEMKRGPRTGQYVCRNCEPAAFELTPAEMVADIAAANPHLTTSPTGALRYNGNKLRVDLISPYAMEGLADVLTHSCTVKRADGAPPYPPRNWEKGLSWEQTLASLERHVMELKKGNLIDPFSGKPHADHIQCNAMFLSHFHHTNTGTNDLPKPKFEALAVFPVPKVEPMLIATCAGFPPCTEPRFPGSPFCEAHFKESVVAAASKCTVAMFEGSVSKGMCGEPCAPNHTRCRKHF